MNSQIDYEQIVIDLINKEIDGCLSFCSPKVEKCLEKYFQREKGTSGDDSFGPVLTRNPRLLKGIYSNIYHSNWYHDLLYHAAAQDNVISVEFLLEKKHSGNNCFLFYAGPNVMAKFGHLIPHPHGSDMRDILEQENLKAAKMQMVVSNVNFGNVFPMKSETSIQKEILTIFSKLYYDFEMKRIKSIVGESNFAKLTK